MLNLSGLSNYDVTFSPHLPALLFPLYDVILHGQPSFFLNGVPLQFDSLGGNIGHFRLAFDLRWWRCDDYDVRISFKFSFIACCVSTTS